jgi:hypothetical protein
MFSGSGVTVSPHGRVEFGGVTQLIMLSPGNYRLKGKYKGQISGRRGLEWRVIPNPADYCCVDAIGHQWNSV